MLCALIVYMRGGTYSLKATPNDRFLRRFFMAIFLLSEFLLDICSEEAAAKKYFHLFVLMSNLGFELGFYIK